jgi:hypothetical protein
LGRGSPYRWAGWTSATTSCTTRSRSRIPVNLLRVPFTSTLFCHLPLGGFGALRVDIVLDFPFRLRLGSTLCFCFALSGPFSVHTCAALLSIRLLTSGFRGQVGFETIFICFNFLRKVICRFACRDEQLTSRLIRSASLAILIRSMTLSSSSGESFSCVSVSKWDKA